MRKWLVAMDVLLVLVSLALLLIDIQIKNQIVAEAKALQETINGGQNRVEENPHIHNSVPGDILPCDVVPDKAVASETLAENGDQESARQAVPKRRTRAASAGIQSTGEQVGS